MVPSFHLSFSHAGYRALQRFTPLPGLSFPVCKPRACGSSFLPTRHSAPNDLTSSDIWKPTVLGGGRVDTLGANPQVTLEGRAPTVSQLVPKNSCKAQSGNRP